MTNPFGSRWDWVPVLALAACTPAGKVPAGPGGQVEEFADAGDPGPVEDPDVPVQDSANGDDAAVGGEGAVDAMPGDATPLDVTTPDAAADAPAETASPCDGFECPEHARCVAAGGAPGCECLPGYQTEGEGCTRDPAAWTPEVSGNAAVAMNVVVVPAAVLAAAAVGDWAVTVPADQAGLLAGVQPGTVMVGPGEKPFLRKVSGVQVEAGTVVVSTVPASLADLFETAELRLPIPLALPGTRSAWVDQDLSGTVVFEGALGGGRMRVTLPTASLAVDPGFSVEYRKGFLGVESLKVRAEGYLDLDLAVEVEWAWTQGYDPPKVELTLGERSVTVLVAGVPVVFTAALKLEFGLDLEGFGCGRATESFTLAADLLTDVGFVAGADPEWTSSDASVLDFQATKPTVTGPDDLAGSIKLFGRLAASVQVYDLAGPYLNAGPYEMVTWDNAEDECSWTLEVGAEGRIGAGVGAFGIDIVETEATMFDLSNKVDEGKCSCDYPALWECLGQATQAENECAGACNPPACDDKRCRSLCRMAEAESKAACLEQSGCWSTPGTGSPNFLDCVSSCEVDGAACFGQYAGADYDQCKVCDLSCVVKCNDVQGTDICDPFAATGG